jgi:uncharacterized protein YwgA
MFNVYDGMNEAEERKMFMELAVELLLCMGLELRKMQLIAFILEKGYGVGTDYGWRFFFDGSHSEKFASGIMVAVGFGLVEMEREGNRLKYRLTDKGVKMLDRLLQRVTMPAEILGNVRTLSSLNTKELLEIARKYERV